MRKSSRKYCIFVSRYEQEDSAVWMKVEVGVICKKTKKEEHK